MSRNLNFFQQLLITLGPKEYLKKDHATKLSLYLKDHNNQYSYIQNQLYVKELHNHEKSKAAPRIEFYCFLRELQLIIDQRLVILDVYRLPHQRPHL